MAKLRHPCIAALYETMMHGPRLYVVMEAAGGGDLCAHVLATRGAARGLPEGRARALAAQLVSAVRHMHCRGVVHRDLKMENIMLDSTKQFIKIVDFGLSNMWNISGALCTPCGSLEYAAPELFVDGRRYGPEVDLWSIGVIVYGMVTGSLPFADAESAEGRSRPQLRAAIARGFSRKQRVALACVSSECKTFIQHLLEPNVELRLKIEEAARHRWIRKPGMRMKTHPLGTTEPKINREIYNQVAELCGQTKVDVISQIKADPFGPVAGIFNIKTHLHLMHSVAGADMLWSTNTVEARPLSPPEYRVRSELEASSSRRFFGHSPPRGSKSPIRRMTTLPPKPPDIKIQGPKPSAVFTKPITTCIPKDILRQRIIDRKIEKVKAIEVAKKNPVEQSPKTNQMVPAHFISNKIIVYDSGDCTMNSRLPSITEHSSTDVCERREGREGREGRAARAHKPHEERARPPPCPNALDCRRADFYRRAGDAMPSWRVGGALATPPARLLIQTTATGIKRASLGNIISPHSSTNSHCKSERAMPVPWLSSKAALGKALGKEALPQRIRRTAPIK
ncbi:PREDICTED: MAP/microtubule affinity-regulating kinase 4-like isoform X2 [Papilio polytes]|nr:PREDICTED: MAP/microtubule affinity-regulating kinase 4-like isoform X2 [Papilio polytes]